MKLFGTGTAQCLTIRALDKSSQVRIVFRPETQELQISSATHTQKVPYSSITKIEAFPIKDQVGCVVIESLTQYFYYCESVISDV